MAARIILDPRDLRGRHPEGGQLLDGGEPVGVGQGGPVVVLCPLGDVPVGVTVGGWWSVSNTHTGTVSCLAWIAALI